MLNSLLPCEGAKARGGKGRRSGSGGTPLATGPGEQEWSLGNGPELRCLRGRRRACLQNNGVERLTRSFALAVILAHSLPRVRITKCCPFPAW